MKTNQRLYLDLHVIQTVPPSCVNRDDTGSPKTAVYGGTVRSRVSSQSWKRAMRAMFSDTFPDNKLSLRTKRIVEMVAEEIEKLEMEFDSISVAQQLLETAGLKIKSAEKGTDALFFMSFAQAKALAALVAQEPDFFSSKSAKEAKQMAQRAINQSPGIDIALFGRMVADDPSLNTDACAQVAHSISTHKVINEYDYFTAVDDCSPEDSAGAGHIGTVEFNSSTLYRYATVAIHELNKHLADDTLEAVREFARAFVCSMPTGKQNTFANRTLPDAVYASLRTDQPINLVGAFEKPVAPSEAGYVAASARRLADHSKKVYDDFAGAPFAAFVTGEQLAALGTPIPFSGLLDSLERELLGCLANGGDDK